MHFFSRKVIWILILFSGNGIPAPGQRLLSGSAQISLITCDPGKELYSVFGHTALRVFDPVNEFDIVYNFGTFDFNTPNFYIKFTRGRLKYTLSRYDFSIFIQEYMRDNRSIYEQKLLLSPSEMNKLFYLLETHYLPENRYYLYDFFFTNCTTKILDLLEETINDPEYFARFDSLHHLSFRQNLFPYLKRKPWSGFGIDLVFGLTTDEVMTIRESMYLPLELMHRLDVEQHRDLVDDIHMVFQASESPEMLPGWASPKSIFWGLFILITLLTIQEIRKGISVRLPDTILFFIIGLQGMLLILLWAFSDHEAMDNNLNILWAIPVNFLVFPFIRFIGKRILRAYFLITGILLLWLLIFRNVIPQEFNPAFYPLILILIVRLFSMVWSLRKRSMQEFEKGVS